MRRKQRICSVREPVAGQGDKACSRVLASQTVRLTIDGMAISVPKGTLVIEAARRVGVMIPHFCYHPKLKPDANCRMCLVEVEKMPKLQTSCSTIGDRWHGSSDRHDAS